MAGSMRVTTFSFANYFDPDHVNFGALRVINDDLIAAQNGFAPHPHNDMEIITYVRQGAITHKDSMGNEGRTGAGDVQVMSAGTGIVHSEYNLENETTNLYQIWIFPRKKGVAPSWDQREFPKEPVSDALPLLVSGYEDAPLSINADARIFGGRINEGATVSHVGANRAYVLVSEGSVTLNGYELNRGDAAQIEDEDSLEFIAQSNAEILVLEIDADAPVH